MKVNPLVRLGELGQSPWYDYITRDLVTTGELDRLIADDGLRGMTSNPTIFEKAVAGSRLYDDEIRALADAGRKPQEIFEHLAVADVRAACDAFTPVYQATGGADGLVSLEVSPTLAHDADATIQEAERLWRAVDRPNAMIKIPGTREGLPAIARSIAAGISVNVTLLFSVERYAEVIDAFLEGL
jgi:transaldolase